jgi:signal transduction histidine kinase
VGRLLLTAACQSARKVVVVEARTGSDAREIEWSILDDGYGAMPEQLLWLTTPFATTQQALFGLGLALARRVVELHGGRITAANEPTGGFRVNLFLPAAAVARNN